MTRRIALDIHTLGQRQTGNETYMRNLVAEFCDMGLPWEFTLYHSRSTTSVAGERLCGRTRRLWPHSPSLRIPLSFPIALYRDKIDLAHFQYVSPPVSPCPTVVTVHDISYEFFPEYFHPLQRARMRLLIPLSARAAAHVITISQFSRNTIIERYGIPPERVSVTPLGVSSVFRSMEHSQVRRLTDKFGIDGPFVLGVGNLQPRKNLARLIQAFAMLRRETSCIHKLVLVGQAAWQGHQVEDEARDAGLGAALLRTGYVSEEELVALYNAADAFAYPSMFEGFGLPVLEAMACGAPVLTSSTSSLPEVAGDAAVVVDPCNTEAIAEGLRTLVLNRPEHDRLRAMGFARAKQFNWTRTARSTAGVYERVLGGD